MKKRHRFLHFFYILSLFPFLFSLILMIMVTIKRKETIMRKQALTPISPLMNMFPMANRTFLATEFTFTAVTTNLIATSFVQTITFVCRRP